MSAPGLKGDFLRYTSKGPNREFICKSIVAISENENSAPNIDWNSEMNKALLISMSATLESIEWRKSLGGKKIGCEFIDENGQKAYFFGGY